MPPPGLTRRLVLGAAATAGFAHRVEALAAMHVVLLGDSVFDNAAYVGGGPDVVRQLRAALPPGAEATLLAQDGAVTSSVAAQLRNVPPATSHLIISVGGNDALGASGILTERASSVAQVLSRMAEIQDRFRMQYSTMLDAAAQKRLPLAVCTIYDPRFENPLQRRLSTLALFVFNDVITREAFARGLQLLDLRLICGDDGDFANPIEPSVQGGQKITAAIVRLVAGEADARVLAR